MLKKFLQSQSSQRRLWLFGAILIVAAAVTCFFIQHKNEPPLDTITLNDGRPKLLDFGMGVCMQCKQMKPVMEKANREFGNHIDVYTLDIREEKNELLAEKFDIEEIPFIILLNGKGKELWRHDGFVEFSEISKVVTKHLEI